MKTKMSVQFKSAITNYIDIKYFLYLRYYPWEIIQWMVCSSTGCLVTAMDTSD